MSYDEMRRGCWDVARAGEGHERRRCAQRRSTSRRSRASPVGSSPRSTTRTSRSRSCRRTTTGTSTSGAVPTPTASSRWRCPVLWDPELAADEVRRTAAKGCHSVTFTENPALLDYPSFHSDAWDPLWAAATDTGDRRVDPPRLGRQARADLGRRAGRRDDDAAAHGRVPVRGRHHVVEDPPASSPASGSPSRRAGPAGSRTSSSASTAPTTSTTSGPARTSARSSRARSSASTSSPASSTTPSACSCATASASTTCPGSSTTRTPTRPGRTRRRSWEWCSPTPHRTTSPRSRTRTRCAGTRSTRSRRAARAVDGGGAPRRVTRSRREHPLARRRSPRALDRGRHRRAPGAVDRVNVRGVLVYKIQPQ